MGDGLATTASGPEDDASPCRHLSPPLPSSPSRSLPSRDLLDGDDDNNDNITNVHSAVGGDDLALANDLVSSSPASTPHGSNNDEPVLISDSHESRSIVERWLPPSLRTARCPQRQLNAQQRITGSKLGSISAQAEGIPSADDQCKLTSSISAPSVSRGLIEADEMQDIDTKNLDEGFYDGGEDGEDMAVERLRLIFRKAGDHRGMRKNVGGTMLLLARPRIRKKVVVRRRRPEERQTL